MKFEEMESQWFRMKKGIMQWCTLSTCLFSVFLDSVVRETKREWVREVTLSAGTIGILLFADDMVKMIETNEMGLNVN